MRKEIRLGGFGGQGIILGGIIIGKAASLFDNAEAVQTQSYGPEARGGASKCEVVISDESIDYPKVNNPDIFVALSHEALIKYLGDLKKNGTLIVDPDMVDLYKKVKIVANIVMIGAIVKATGVVSEEAAREAILDSVPKGTEKKNIQAFEAGLNLI